MEPVNADRFIDSLLRGKPQASPSSWLNRIRAEALERANSLTLPTTRDEEWRFTDPSPLMKFSFQPAGGSTKLTQSAIQQRFVIPEASSDRLVFIDGVYAPELSTHAGHGHGILISNLAQGGSAHGAVMEAHLARHARFENDVFCALNTAFLHDGAWVVIKNNTNYPTPIHLLFIATQKETVAYPRCLVVAEQGSRCTLVEEYVSLNEEVHFTNAVTEIVVGENARITHTRLQNESRNSFHIAHCTATLAKDAHYACDTVTLGARLSRYNLNVVQAAEGARCTLDGLALISGRQLADTHSFIDHTQPHGASRQLHKCIVGGAAHAVFNGKIMVRPGAQLIDSAQSSRNLLLSDKAHVDTKPQLEIFADDVKCAHGATVGQLDAEEVFYLRSRGLDEAEARSLLTYAFAAEIIDKIPVASLARKLKQKVMEQTQVREQA
ncbi:MAG TPA: Fe-S cluster assembly protein SufD [Burkholderiales bacterium]|nr:Fe-S cluster assembly protein SufD [Burkholderiales bacterium]